MSYEQGFMDKCAQFGIDPDALVKQSNAFTEFLEGLWKGPRYALARQHALKAIQNKVAPESGAHYFSDEALKLMANNMRGKIGRGAMTPIDEYLMINELRALQNDPKKFAKWMLDAGLSNASNLGEGVGTLGAAGLGLAGIGGAAYGGAQLGDHIFNKAE